MSRYVKAGDADPHGRLLEHEPDDRVRIYKDHWGRWHVQVWYPFHGWKSMGKHESLTAAEDAAVPYRERFADGSNRGTEQP